MKPFAIPEADKRECVVCKGNVHHSGVIDTQSANDMVAVCTLCAWNIAESLKAHNAKQKSGPEGRLD